MSHRLFPCIAAALVCVFQLSIARGAEFQKVPIPGSQFDLITVVGDLVAGDDKRFIEFALGASDAIVAFQSRGGSLVSGIEIGKAIRLKGFSTLVPDGTQCASACALAWLGGRVRFMGRGAQVGFHAVYVDDNGQATVSSAGNALVGAYLNQLGLSSAAIMYITEPSPNEIKWLTFSDAQGVGIDVRAFTHIDHDDGAQPKDQTAGPQNGAPTASAIDAVQRETSALIDTGNLSNDNALSILPTKYAEQVNYYGKPLSRDAVISDKKRFFARWPNRNYTIQPSSMSANCVTSSECAVTAVVSWKVSNNLSVSEGAAAISLGWVLDGQRWRINSEGERILKRAVSSATPTPAAADTLTAGGPPRYQLDHDAKNVVSLFNLSPDQSCAKVTAPISGKVVQRKFGDDGLTVSGIVVEEPDGSRSFVNVEVHLDASDQATRTWVMKGLQTLLAEGRSSQISYRACGAAGRVLELDAVR